MFSLHRRWLSDRSPTQTGIGDTMSELDPVEEAARFWPDDDGEETDPRDVSLFIGGKEFVFDGVGDPDGQSVYGQLRIARTKLEAEIADPEGAGHMLDMTTEEVLVFLKARLEVLNWLIANITPQFPPDKTALGGPEEISYPIPR
jgi:hypothetical protein